MNGAIVRRATNDVVARYEVHRAGNGSPPPDAEYFDEAWQRAVEDGLIPPPDGQRRVRGEP